MRKNFFLILIVVLVVVFAAYGLDLSIHQFNKEPGYGILGIAVVVLGIGVLIAGIMLFRTFQKKKSEPSQGGSRENNREDDYSPYGAGSHYDYRDDQDLYEDEQMDRRYDRETKSPQRDAQEEREEEIEPVMTPKAGPSSTYVKAMGHGPVLEARGNRIRDLRSNLSYRFDGDGVYVDGEGKKFEVMGKGIRSVEGELLFERQGGTISKGHDGPFASINGRMITRLDNMEKYEMTDWLTDREILLVVALLFGEEA